jgi:hypothetical protein
VAKEPQHIVFDALADFAAGMNSGLDPFLIPKNQLSFAVNCTVRGNFVSDRPPYQRISTSFSDNTASVGFRTGLFQGATYYAPDSGQQRIVTQIGGRIFVFTPSTNDYTGSIVEVPVTDPATGVVVEPNHRLGSGSLRSG